MGGFPGTDPNAPELAVTVPLPIEELAALVAHRLAELREPYITARKAADYLACPLSRIRALTAANRIPHHRDGRRVLYRREELDEYIAGGGARRP